MKKKQPDAQAAAQQLKDEALDHVVGGNPDLGVWRQSYGSTIPSSAGTGGGTHVKVFDGRGG